MSEDQEQGSQTRAIYPTRNADRFDRGAQDGGLETDLSGNFGYWYRYYSPKRQQWFMVNHATRDIFWEAQKVAVHWEKFMGPAGDFFYVHNATGELSFENPLKPSPTLNVVHESSDEVAHSPVSDVVKPAHQYSSKMSMSGDVATDTRKEKPAKPFLMFDPRTQERMAWDFLIVIPLLVYLSITMPFMMCFAYEPPMYSSISNFQVFIDCTFICDIALNFRTGFLTADEELVMSPAEVAKNYISSWFPLDVMSSIPFSIVDLLGSSSINAFSFLKSARVLKFLRILRFLKFARLLKGASILKRMDPNTRDDIEDMFANPSYKSSVRLFIISIAISYTAHIMACLWVLVGRIADQQRAANENRPIDNWKGQYEWHGNPYTNWLQQQGFTYKQTTKRRYVRSIYLAAYYFVMTVMTSVGFGDISGFCDKERAFIIVLEALGGFMYAIIIAALTSIVSTMDSNQRIVAEKLDAVGSYVQNKNFPPQLGRRMRRYFRHYYSQKPGVDESEILSELSEALRAEVSTFLMSKIVEKVPLFHWLESTIWAKMLTLLRPARFERDEYVCKQFESCTEMFIVMEGQVIAETFVDELSIREISQSPSSSFGDEAKNENAQELPLVSVAERLQNGGALAAPLMSSSDHDRAAVVHYGHCWVEPATKEDVAGVKFMRLLVDGGTLNMACLVHLSHDSLETAKAEKPTQTFAINTDDFFHIFPDEEEGKKITTKLRDRVTETMFHMVEDLDAPTEKSPLFQLNAIEIASRQKALDARLKEKKARINRLKSTRLHTNTFE